MGKIVSGRVGLVVVRSFVAAALRQLRIFCRAKSSVALLRSFCVVPSCLFVPSFLPCCAFAFSSLLAPPVEVISSNRTRSCVLCDVCCLSVASFSVFGRLHGACLVRTTK